MRRVAEKQGELRRKRLLALQEDNFFGVAVQEDAGVDDGDDFVPPVDGEADLGFLRGTGVKRAKLKQPAKKKAPVKPLFVRKSLKSVLELEEQGKASFVPTIDNIAYPDSRLARRTFCCVCGMLSVYTCRKCSQRFCSLNCDEAHKETRCLKFAK
jgi:zinc finger HIT domain-containing protein 1